MNILVIGGDDQLTECAEKFGRHSVSRVANHQEAGKKFHQVEVVFDFTIADNKEQIKVYQQQHNIIAFLNTATVSLSTLTKQVNHHVACTAVGFCGMPTFLNRPILEVAAGKNTDVQKLKSVCEQLQTEFSIVDDRVGLVTPRVISMIINEAYYTVQEGTATREDIDLAMKLGTNYPYGPFEWCSKIGVRHVYELLEAVYNDTKDERYKISPLLKKEFLAS